MPAVRLRQKNAATHRRHDLAIPVPCHLGLRRSSKRPDRHPLSPEQRSRPKKSRVHLFNPVQIRHAFLYNEPSLHRRVMLLKSRKETVARQIFHRTFVASSQQRSRSHITGFASTPPAKPDSGAVLQLFRAPPCALKKGGCWGPGTREFSHGEYRLTV